MTTEKDDRKTLTASERRTYDSLRGRGFAHDAALQDALDGVQLDTLRAERVRAPDTDTDTDTDTDRTPTP